MKERQIGLRELKSKLSQCVREVKAGATIVITDRGRPVARLVREGESVAERIEALRKAGSIQWSGHRLAPAKPGPPVRGKRTVSDIVIENRD